MNFKNEEGFWSAVFLLFLMTLTLMGLGASAIMKNEAPSLGNQINGLKAEYGANGAAYFGIAQLNALTFSDTSGIVFGEATVSFDTSMSGDDVVLLVTSEVAGIVHSIEIVIEPPENPEDNAIYITGTVINVSTLDSLGNIDPDLLVQNLDELPTIDEDSLKAMAIAQGRYFNSFDDDTFNVHGGCSDFYQADGVTPNVTYVSGDLVMAGNEELHGIYVVEGDIKIPSIKFCG